MLNASCIYSYVISLQVNREDFTPENTSDKRLTRLVFGRYILQRFACYCYHDASAAGAIAKFAQINTLPRPQIKPTIGHRN